MCLSLQFTLTENTFKLHFDCDFIMCFCILLFSASQLYCIYMLMKHFFTYLFLFFLAFTINCTIKIKNAFPAHQIFHLKNKNWRQNSKQWMPRDAYCVWEWAAKNQTNFSLVVQIGYTVNLYWFISYIFAFKCCTLGAGCIEKHTYTLHFIVSQFQESFSLSLIV